MSFSWSKKTTFEKNNIIKLQNQGLFYRKVDLKDINKNFEQNHGFIFIKYAKYSLRTLLLRKNISKRQDRCLLHRKEASKDIWNIWPESWVNPF